jgi:transcriptional regulator with XRE-family HTH domain
MLSSGNFPMTKNKKVCAMICQVTTNGFSEWLEDQLRIHNWSNADLARIARIDPAVISRALSSERMLSPESLQKIARAFKLPTEEVYRNAGLLPKNGHQVNDRAARLAYRIAQLPDDEQLFLERMLDGLYRGQQRNDSDALSNRRTDPLPQPD